MVDKGTLLVECGNLLAKAKYQIKVLNLINFKKSMHYNPFMYIHSEKDKIDEKMAEICTTSLIRVAAA